MDCARSPSTSRPNKPTFLADTGFASLFPHGRASLSSHLICSNCSRPSWKQHPDIFLGRSNGTLGRSACMLRCTIGSLVQLIHCSTQRLIVPVFNLLMGCQTLQADRHLSVRKHDGVKFMRNLGRHCISRQSSGPWRHTRTSQSMTHRRSSDVASASWLIHGQTGSWTFISPSVSAFTNGIGVGYPACAHKQIWSFLTDMKDMQHDNAGPPLTTLYRSNQYIGI